MKLEIKRIYLPNDNEENKYCTYQNQLKPRKDFANSELEELFNSHELEIMKIVEKEISEYVNSDDVCNDDEDFFPRRCVLTGEWYVSDICFSQKDCLSIMTAFLGIDLGYKDDYLGLEVLLTYDEDSASFIFDTINSESL